MNKIDELMALAKDSQGFGWSVTKEQLRTALDQALAEARVDGYECGYDTACRDHHIPEPTPRKLTDDERAELWFMALSDRHKNGLSDDDERGLIPFEFAHLIERKIWEKAQPIAAGPEDMTHYDAIAKNHNPEPVAWKSEGVWGTSVSLEKPDHMKGIWALPLPKVTPLYDHPGKID